MEGSKNSEQESMSDGMSDEESELVEESLNFSSPWHFSDVVLAVEDTKFHVHRSTLSMWSPVFEAMFTGQFKESTAKLIPLPGKCAEEVKELLKVIYSSSWTRPEITEENYQCLLELADEYQMMRVKKLCSEFLVGEIEVSNCLEYCKLAAEFGLDDVMEVCQDEACVMSSADLEGSKHFNSFEPELKVDICMKIIKELEKTLEEYVTTCSDLVQKVYKNAYESCYHSINRVHLPEGLYNTQEYKDSEEHIQAHEQLQSKFKSLASGVELGLRGSNYLDPKDYNTKFFELSCTHCIQRVQGMKWNTGSYTILQDLVTKLYTLQVSNE